MHRTANPDGIEYYPHGLYNWLPLSAVETEKISKNYLGYFVIFLRIYHSNFVHTLKWSLKYLCFFML